jgi:hypothetical protein
MEETRTVNFRDVPVWASQQTIVKILKQVKYGFKPVSEYENTQFYCITEQKEYDPVKESLRTFGFKPKDKYTSCPLAITVCGMYKGEPIVEPIVFTREDVKRIIADVPENYTGPEIL